MCVDISREKLETPEFYLLGAFQGPVPCEFAGCFQVDEENCGWCAVPSCHKIYRQDSGTRAGDTRKECDALLRWFVAFTDGMGKPQVTAHGSRFTESTLWVSTAQAADPQPQRTRTELLQPTITVQYIYQTCPSVTAMPPSSLAAQTSTFWVRWSLFLFRGTRGSRSGVNAGRASGLSSRNLPRLDESDKCLVGALQGKGDLGFCWERSVSGLCSDMPLEWIITDFNILSLMNIFFLPFV